MDDHEVAYHETGSLLSDPLNLCDPCAVIEGRIDEDGYPIGSRENDLDAILDELDYWT